MHATDVAIVGSGPYALSLAAHLRARGVEFRIFGPPMKFWLEMPSTINLKSFAHATNVFVPAKGYTFPEWCRANQLEDFEPCSMASFAAYGLSMKERFVPDLDSTAVARVALRDGGFDLTLADERIVQARRCVFATGLTHMAHLPPALRDLPADLLTHTFEHPDFAALRGKDVAIVGGGASAIEAGALVHEAGGNPRILIRDREAVFHGRLKVKRSLYERLRYPNSVLGPSMKSWALEHFPMAVHFVPREPRVRFVKNHLGPAAPWWIRDRVEGKVPILTGVTVVASERRGGRVLLRMRDAASGDRTLEVDRVIAGTGYVADVDRMAYLDPDLRRRIRRVESAPELTMDFESSVRGAFFLGPAAAMSFGPLFRFVAGARFAAPRLARRLSGGSHLVADAVSRLRFSAASDDVEVETVAPPQ